MSKQIEVYQIDTGVPLPGTALPPIRQLAVGESILFPLNKRNTVQSLASRLKKETGREFKIQKQSDEAARVWRIK